MKCSFIYSLICALLISACAPAQAWSFNALYATVKNKSYTIGACVAAAIGASFMWCWYKKSQKKVVDSKAHPETTVAVAENNMTQQLAEQEARHARIRAATSTRTENLDQEQLKNAEVEKQQQEIMYSKQERLKKMHNSRTRELNAAWWGALSTQQKKEYIQNASTPEAVCAINELILDHSAGYTSDVEV